MAVDPFLDYELVIPENLWMALQAHLFPGDGDEHGAVILAGMAISGGRARLLARELYLAEDGIDYLPGQRGYRMLSAGFVRDKALIARDERLSYLAIHNHGGRNSVSFSTDDLRSHERGYPALQDLTRGQLVGGIVFAENAVAGDLWLKDGRIPLMSARIIGKNIVRQFPSPPERNGKVDPSFDRQARIFGDRGQASLGQQRVGIIGLGGIGSLVSEYMARVGVGELILVDPDKLDPTNVPRVVGSSRWDALSILRGPGVPGWLRTWASRLSRWKVSLAKRHAHEANPSTKVLALPRNVVDSDVAQVLATCDFIFLSADSMQARHVFNALVHQYLIPGIQLGVKIPVDSATGEVGRIFSAVRPVLPGRGCLWCNGLIPPAKLQEEALSEEERRAQRYVDEPEVHAPSVITLNATSAAYAVNDYLFRTLGLHDLSAPDDYHYLEPQSSTTRMEIPRSDPSCLECGTSSRSRLARGDGATLPTRPRR